MTGYTRHDLPADIVVHAGNFSGQPDAFAYLLGACDAIDLTHVEVIRDRAATRLAARFDADTTAEIAIAAGAWNTIVLILPAAYDTLDCPLGDSAALPLLGIWRGRVPHMVADRPAR